VLRKKSDPAAWEAAVDADDQRYLDPPLDAKALAAVIKSVRTHDYFYKCKDQPICAVCDKATCRTRQFGIGPDYDPYGDRFQVVDGRLCYLSSKGLTELCNFAGRIVEDQIIDDGADEQRRYLIEGTLDDRTPLPPITVPAEKFGGAGWVGPRWGARPIVHAGGGQAMLCEAIQTVSGPPSTRRIFAHLGWRRVEGRSLYLHAGGAIGADGPVDGIAVEVAGELANMTLPPVRDLERAVRASLGLLDLNATVAAATWRAPLAEFRDVTFSAFRAGRTGSLKSATWGVAQAHWGERWDGVHFAANWSGTVNSVEKLAFLAKDTLLCIDDFVPRGSGKAVSELHQKAEQVLRAAGNLGGRSRMNRDMSLRPTYWPRGLIASSGEDVPAGHSLRARMAIEQVGPNDINQALLSQLQRAAAEGLLAEAMAGYVRWIADQGDAIGDELRDRQLELRADVAGDHRRTPDIAASLALGIDFFLRFAAEAGVVGPEERERLWSRAWQALRAGAAAQSAEHRQEDPVQMFVEAIPAVLAAGMGHLANRGGEVPETEGNPTVFGWRRRSSFSKEVSAEVTQIGSEWAPQGVGIGWIEGYELWVLPDPAIAAVQRMLREQGKSLAIGRNALGKQLRDAGWIIDSTDGSFTKVVTVGGSSQRVFAMDRGKVIGGEGDDTLPF
jgi:hypothetical protein